MMLPPIVALQRIRILATSGQVCAKAGSRARTSGDVAIRSCVTRAPRRKPSSNSSIPSSPATLPRWIKSVTGKPDFIRFTTSMPPAMYTAPGPAAAFIATASAALCGRCRRKSGISLRDRCTASGMAVERPVRRRLRSAFRRHTTAAQPILPAPQSRTGQARCRRGARSPPAPSRSRRPRRQT